MTTLSQAARGNFFDIVHAYARKGLADWTSKNSQLQTKVRAAVQNLIEENSAATDAKFAQANTGTDPGFHLLPAPNHVHSHFEAAFFIPKMTAAKHGALNLRFYFLLWKNGSSQNGETVGFRLESAHAPNTAHSYPHVQLCKKFKSPNLAMTIRDWIPDSYPAVPIMSRDPYDMFFSMVAAIHGHKPHQTPSPMIDILTTSLQQDAKTGLIQNVNAHITNQFQRLII